MKKAISGVSLLSVAIGSCLSLFPAPVVGAPVTFEIDGKANRDVVSFTSDAPIELIVGRTSKIDGHLKIDDSLDLSKKPLEAVFEVPLATIDTGIELRNEHMRDNFLETAKYPTATFKLTSLKNSKAVLKPGQKTRIMAQGDFTLHGKTVTKLVPVDVTYMRKCEATESVKPGCDLIQIKATFPVPFKDHEIKRPEAVFTKLADTVFVSVAASAWATARGSSSASTGAPQPAKGGKTAEK